MPWWFLCPIFHQMAETAEEPKNPWCLLQREITVSPRFTMNLTHRLAVATQPRRTTTIDSTQCFPAKTMLTSSSTRPTGRWWPRLHSWMGRPWHVQLTKDPWTWPWGLRTGSQTSLPPPCMHLLSKQMGRSTPEHLHNTSRNNSILPTCQQCPVIPMAASLMTRVTIFLQNW